MRPIVHIMSVLVFAGSAILVVGLASAANVTITANNTITVTVSGELALPNVTTIDDPQYSLVGSVARPNVSRADPLGTRLSGSVSPPQTDVGVLTVSVDGVVTGEFVLNFWYYDLETGFGVAFPERSTSICFTAIAPEGWVYVETYGFSYNYTQSFIDTCFVTGYPWDWPNTTVVFISGNETATRVVQLYQMTMARFVSVEVQVDRTATIVGNVTFLGYNVPAKGEIVALYVNGIFVGNETVSPTGLIVFNATLDVGNNTLVLDPAHGSPSVVYIYVPAILTSPLRINVSVPLAYEPIQFPSFPEPSLRVASPGLYSPYSLIMFGLFLGIFIIYSKIFPWAQALVVASALSLVISIVLLGNELIFVFLVLLFLGIALWKVL